MLGLVQQSTCSNTEKQNFVSFHLPSCIVCLHSLIRMRKKRKRKKNKNWNPINFIPRFSVIFDSKATGLGRRSRLFWSRTCMGWWRRKRIWSFQVSLRILHRHISFECFGTFWLCPACGFQNPEVPEVPAKSESDAISSQTAGFPSRPARPILHNSH